LFAGMIQLDTDEGWDSMMAAVAQVIDLITLAAKISELTSVDREQLLNKFRAGLDPPFEQPSESETPVLKNSQ
jgi:hypothetical protein